MSYLALADVGDSIKQALINAWRFINGQLDSIAYKLLSSVYDFFKQLSEMYLYNEKIMQTIGKRIGLILGIFILFRLAIAIVSYIINPDKVADGSKGTKKIITNIALSLILLGTVNMIFKEAYIIQKKIISNQTIEKIFFGDKVETDDINLSFYLYSSFLQLGLDSCKDDDVYSNDNLSDSCIAQVQSEPEATNLVNKIREKHKLDTVLSSYDSLNYKINDDYLFDYTPVISLVCAIIALLMLLSSCMDVATRIIKLLFLQIIAPIPIVSNMAPGKGEETFKKWYKECINTYLSLFIRIAVISFAIFMITLLKTEFAEILKGKNMLIQVLLIIGCLIFAKQTPKLIENIFGIKMDGMLLHPLKKFQDQALFGKNIVGLGAAGLAGGAAFGANAFARGSETIKSFRKDGLIAGMGSLAYGLGSSIAGGISATGRGFTGAVKGDKFAQIFKNSYGAAISAREKRDERRDDDVGYLEMQKNKLQRAAHQKTRGQRADELDKNLENYKKNGEAIKNAIFANDKKTFRFTDSKGQIHDFAGAKGLKEFIDNMQGPTQAPGENPEIFAQRQEEFIKYKNEFKDELDRQVSSITTGTRSIDDNNGGNSGGAAAQASVNKMLASMDEQLETINAEGTELYGADFKTIDSATAPSSNNMSLKNSLGAATGAQTTISSHAGHDRDVDKYGAKKDAK